MEFIKKAPVYLRLKAAARALVQLAKKDNKGIDLTIAWWENCIIPLLGEDEVRFEDFEDKEIEQIRELAENNNLALLTEE